LNGRRITWVWRNGGISPQKRQCNFASYYPARTFVKPPLRQALARYRQVADCAPKTTRKTEKPRAESGGKTLK